ncbi:iron ABC transporter permease [Aquabacterium olei]|uniref:Iron ABC transporter permease n=1 Tax=Aquabacterium olei TaxID=1296669 RepID=A0A2U8FQA5_9BURK|nr:iron ABC transporter permease [Aquabacterium olei]AWI52496.1 iron ABC transporter permease [Aquabacterium olei]
MSLTLPSPAAAAWRLSRLPALWFSVATLVVGALMALPVLAVISHVLSTGTGDTWAHLSATVLPDYIRSTLVLCVGVGFGTACMGVGAAWLVTRYDFPLRGALEWALVLPLAVPAYVMAYTYTDLLQFVGPVQTALREAFGWTRADYWFPDVRSLGGAVVLFSLVLYPYVYMLARTAFLERAGGMLEAGRSLGLGPWASFFRVSLPLARPAIAAGVALALMETLADFGAVSYFGVQTFTTGIYRAWFSLGDRVAAAQLATALLGFVVLVLAMERLSRGRARFHDTTLRRARFASVRLRGGRAALAVAACLLPLCLGFLLPAGILLEMAVTEGDAQFGTRFIELARNSVTVSAMTAFIAVLLALLLGYAARLQASWLVRGVHRLAGLGYALPGTVIAVGVLIPVTRIDNWLTDWASRTWGWEGGLLITGGLAGLVYACAVRFLTPAVQAVDAGLLKVTPNMDNASRSLGLTPAATLRRVHFPLLRGSLLTAALLVFIDVMKELPATLVMRPFNFDTLATQAYTLASDERLTEASTAALAIVVVGLLPLIVLSSEIARGRQGEAAPQ